MGAQVSIEDRISEHYSELSAKLRTAADYVAGHPIELATRSLRSVAQTSGVSPATFSRLARALGFEDYEEMREAGRAAVGQKLVPFSERARNLRSGGSEQEAVELLHMQAAACTTNIAYLEQNTSVDRLEEAVSVLHNARNVLLMASRGSAGIFDYFGYQAQWFKSNWTIAGQRAASTPAALSNMGPDDVVMALVKTPYARQTISGLKEARVRGISTIVLTDSHTSPALKFATQSFVIPTDNPNFFSSYVATMVLLETIMSMLLRMAGPEAESRIREVEDQTVRLGDNWIE